MIATLGILALWVSLAGLFGMAASASTGGGAAHHKHNGVHTYTSFATDRAAPQMTLSYAPSAGYTLGQKSISTSPTEAVPKPTVTAECVVIPLGWGQDDAGQIMAAAETCGTDGAITLPAPYVYTISSRLYMRLERARLNVLGTLSFEPDLGYWIANSHRIEFQNQSTAWILEGNDFVVSGGGWQQGGILGNGQAWYGRAAGHSNQFGRPVSLTVHNSSNVTIENFAVRQPQFWTFYLQDIRDIALTGIYINGTNTDPYGNASNYETNIDGFDSVRVDGLVTQDWLFHGGDDCHAPKGNSTNMVFQNITCVGGGIAFGSVGQYPALPDYIENVTVSDISVAQKISPAYGGNDVDGAIYFKSWVGVSEGEPPQGGGGGTGRVGNISVSNVRVADVAQAVYVNKCYYKVADQKNYCDTSTLEFANMSFANISGVVRSTYGISLNCSAKAPCQNLNFSGLDIQTANGSSVGSYCDNIQNANGIKCE